jgi:hypothetical protein
MNNLTDYIRTLFNIDNNTSATLIVTLTVFFLGFLFTGILKSIREYLYRRNYRRIFKEMLSEIIRCTNKQSSNIIDLVESLKIENEDFFKFRKQNINLLNEFNKIPFDTFYSAYFKGIENTCKGKKLSAFNKTFGLIDTLNKNENQILVELNNCVSNFNMHGDKWNDSTEKVRLDIENLRILLDGKPISRILSDFYQAIDQIILNWQKQPNPTQYYIAYSQLIKPLLDLFNANSNAEILKVTKMLLDDLINSQYHYRNMTRSLEFYHLLFLNFKYQYDRLSRLLFKINKILN